MGSFYMEATQINYRRDETLKTVDQKLQELSEESAVDTDIAPVFSKTATYNPGDLVYFKNKLYVCVTQHTGAWAAGDFTATTVSGRITASDEAKADNIDLAPAFNSETSYAAGDLVTYNGTVYRCTNDHTGAWDANDFSATTISAELGSLKSGLTNYQTQNDINLEVPNRKNVGYFDLEHAKKASITGVWNGNQYTILGITYTLITDNNGNVTEVKASGTSTGDAALRFSQRSSAPVNLQTGSYIVSGGNSAGAFVLVGRTYNGGWQEIARSGASESAAFNVDISDNLGISINIDQGATVDDISFYPMIRPATITDPTFAPYIPSVESRIEAVESYTEVNTIYKPEQRAWSGSSLVYNIPLDSAAMLHFIACGSPASNSFVEAYFVLREQNQSIKIQKISEGLTITYDSTTKKTTVTLPSTDYWIERMELCARSV